MRAKISFAVAIGMLGAGLAGCQGDAIAANQRIVQEQQAQLERMQREIEALKVNQPAGYRAGAAAPAGGCDRDVEAVAIQRGADHFATGDFVRALGYYQDALSACPGDARAELNVARGFEALGDKTKAVDHYRAAASTAGGVVSDAQQQARAALDRLQASRMP